jgi:cysteine synthase A
MCQLDDYFPNAPFCRIAPGLAWAQSAIADLLAEPVGRAETPLRELPLPGLPGIRLLLKDESAHPSGSLKHRLARSLLLHALQHGRLRQGQAVVDASSGSTAISEAWFARRLGLPFHAVMPCCTGSAKQAAVVALGGQCVLVDAGVDPVDAAQALARDLDACYLDQFGLAATATDWRGGHNIAAAILAQCRDAGVDDPDWIVCGAGTGGTSATLGRHLRHVGSHARVCVADPLGAAFALGWRRRDRDAVATRPTCIEGIGRARVEPCFAFAAADAVAEVDDAASIAGAWWLERRTGQRFGGSSGTNLAAALELAAAMHRRGERGVVVALLCDRGERYADTIFDPAWVARQGLRPEPWLRALERTAQSGVATGTADLARAPLRPVAAEALRT